LLRHADFTTKGGLQTFAASAKLKEQREESGRSGHQPVFSVVQTRRMACVDGSCIARHMGTSIYTKFLAIRKRNLLIANITQLEDLY
jgi:hypothetical protein